MTRQTPGAADGRLAAAVASPGLASGTVSHLRAVDGQARIAATTPAKERRRLNKALETARREITALADGTVEGEAAHILQIQLDILADPALTEPARPFIERVRRDLRAYWLGFGDAPLGMMVEVPAAALAIADFDADFYSIGGNDLVQYATAVSREAPDLEALARPDNPGVLRLIEEVVRHGESTGRDVSLCGDIGGDPCFIGPLLERGLASLSVAPAALPRTKAIVHFARSEAD